MRTGCITSKTCHAHEPPPPPTHIAQGPVDRTPPSSDPNTLACDPPARRHRACLPHTQNPSQWAKGSSPSTRPSLCQGCASSHPLIVPQGTESRLSAAQHAHNFRNAMHACMHRIAPSAHTVVQQPATTPFGWLATWHAPQAGMTSQSPPARARHAAQPHLSRCASAVPLAPIQQHLPPCTHTRIDHRGISPGQTAKASPRFQPQSISRATCICMHVLCPALAKKSRGVATARR